jgi:hypothetical protein
VLRASRIVSTLGIWNRWSMGTRTKARFWVVIGTGRSVDRYFVQRRAQRAQGEPNELGVPGRRAYASLPQQKFQQARAMTRQTIRWSNALRHVQKIIACVGKRRREDNGRRSDLDIEQDTELVRRSTNNLFGFNWPQGSLCHTKYWGRSLQRQCLEPPESSQVYFWGITVQPQFVWHLKIQPLTSSVDLSPPPRSHSVSGSWFN